MTVLDCACVLQAWIPSDHVWSSLVLPALPQVLNQEPPRPQQLIFPDLSMAPHLGHKETVIVVVSAGVFMYIGQDRTRKTLKSDRLALNGVYNMQIASNLRLQAATPSNHL